MNENWFYVLDTDIKRVYDSRMIERDPITEWEHAIERRLGAAVMVAILCAFICLLIAPAFGPLIKRFKRKQYAISRNYEELAEQDMRGIRPLLWVGAIIGWIFFIFCQCNYP